MDKKIFFSYGHDKYKDFVLKVQKYLEEKEGFQVFVDSDKLRMGDDWEHKLEQAIEENNKMVFFITKHAARRPDGYCLNEISMALAHNKKVFPVMLEEHILPLSLIRKQYLDLRSCLAEDEDQKEGIFEAQVKYLIEVLNSNSDLEHGDVQQKLIKRLKPIDFQSDYARHGRIIGREWVMDEVNDWLETQTKSKVLWITAEAGYGKSAISADLARHPKVMSVHFCNYNSPDTQDPRSVVKTLAYNLQAQQIEGYREEIQYVELEGKNAFELFRDLIANPLSKVKKEGSEYLFVIDALDETLGDDNLELITLLGSDEFHWGLPDFVKIIITSRPEPKINQAISKYNPLELKADRKENRDDCKKYIEVKLAELNRDNVENNEELVDVIMKNSSANMLYLTKFFEDDTLDLSQPDKFPKDLQEIYWRFFRRITKDINEYDEKLSPILEVMLAYGESIPKLLLADILDLPFKTLKRRLAMFGSMLRENEGILDFYHKSLRDWLVSDENEDYYIDVTLGKKKLMKFIDDLTSIEYKIEYVKFDYFNALLVMHAIYDFFDLVKNIENKKKIQMYDNLWNYFYDKNDFFIAVTVSQKAVENTKQLFKRNENLWIFEYITALNNMAFLYNTVNEIDQAIEVQTQGIKLLEPIIENDIEKWGLIYTTALNQLANSYRKINQAHNAIKYNQKSLAIIKVLYRKNPAVFTADYLFCINDLSISYYLANKTKEAIDLMEGELEVFRGHLNKGFNDDSKSSMNNLGTVLQNLGDYYEGIKEYDKAIIFHKEAMELKKILYLDDPKHWGMEFSHSLQGTASVYHKLKKTEIAIKFAEEGYSHIKIFYFNNPEVWSKDYINILNDLSRYYAKTKQSKEAIKFQKESYELVKVLYKNNRLQWIKEYSTAINHLSVLELKRFNILYAFVLIIKSYSSDSLLIWLFLLNFFKNLTKSSQNDSYPCGSGKKYKKCCGKN